MTVDQKHMKSISRYQMNIIDICFQKIQFKTYESNL